MAYYNPRRWIDPTDNLLPETENVLKLEKLARQRATSGAGRTFLPPVSMEFDVIIKGTEDIIRMTEWVDTSGKIFIELTHESHILRKGHFKQGWHHNPNNQEIPPPHHVHFPTKKYPLSNTQSSTYAYSIQSNNNHVEALLRLCNHNNIEVRGISVPLISR